MLNAHFQFKNEKTLAAPLKWSRDKTDHRVRLHAISQSSQSWSVLQSVIREYILFNCNLVQVQLQLYTLVLGQTVVLLLLR